MNAGGFALAVVGDDYVLPFVSASLAFGFEAYGQIGPAMNNVDAQLSVYQIEALAHSFEIILGAGDDTAVGRAGLIQTEKVKGSKIAEVGDLSYRQAYRRNALPVESGQVGAATKLKAFGDGPIRAGRRQMVFPLTLLFFEAGMQSGVMRFGANDFLIERG